MSGASWVTVVGSVAVLLPGVVSPPPDTMAVLIKDGAALAATSTVTVIEGYAAPAASGSERLQFTVGPGAHIQPVPLALVRVMPTGKVSVTVTVPEVDAVPTLLAVSVYVNPT